MKSLSQDQYNTLKARGLSDERIAELASKKGYGMPTNKDFLQKAESVVGSIFPGRKVGEAIGTLGGFAYTKAKDALQGTNNAQYYDTSAPSVAQVGGDIVSGIATVGGLKAPMAGSVLGRLGTAAGLGGVTAGATTVARGGTAGDATKSALLGATLGGAVAGAGEIARVLPKAVPKLLSYTSETPDEVLMRNFNKPQVMAKAKTAVAGGAPAVRENTQAAVRSLRTQLSSQWDDGVEKLVETNKAKRIGLAGKEEQLLNKIIDDYGIEVPKNIQSMSIKEALSLNKNINELYSKFDVKQGAGGVVVRQFKDILDDKISGFSGASDFLKNYGAEKQVFDSANAIVKAYGKNPITFKTVESRLRNAFNENNTAYISALSDLEKKLGVPILDKVAALATNKVMPKFDLGGGVTEKLIKTLLLPLTSPRGAAFLSRMAGRGSNVVSKAIPQAVTTKVAPIVVGRNTGN